jgi:hypothetical protein
MSALSPTPQGSTPLVRTKMLLEVPDVAHELGVEPIDVRRLIARGELEARTVGADKLRVERAAVERLLMKHIQLEISDQLHLDWFDSRPENLRAGEFKAKVRDAIEAVIPDDDPGADQDVRYSRRIREAGSAVPRPLLIAVFGSRELPYANVIELYAVSELRRLARQEVNRSSVNARVEGKRPRGPLEVLYASQESYKKITAEAMQRYGEKAISVRRDYEEGTREFSLKNASLPVDMSKALRLAF